MSQPRPISWAEYCNGPRREAPTAKNAYFLGLDLGKASDPSALAINRVTFTPQSDGSWSRRHAIVHLHRWKLKTPYTVDEEQLKSGKIKPGIAEDLRDMVQKDPLYYPRVGVDYTGVGHAVVDIFRSADLACILEPILITAGFHTTMQEGCWHVPKKELVAVLRGVLDGERIAFADVPLRKQLLQEIETFKLKTTTQANQQFEAWRTKDFDDVVLALCMAVWLGELHGPGTDSPKIDPPRSPTIQERYYRPSAQVRRGLFGLKRPR